MENLVVFLFGFFTAILFAEIIIAWSMSINGTITIRPVKDDYKNEILYYIDTNTKKTYKMENDILYYCEV